MNTSGSKANRVKLASTKKGIENFLTGSLLEIRPMRIDKLPHMTNVMLLARDMNGRRIYSSKAELATALNVGGIYTAEQFANKTRKTSDNKIKKLIGIIVNLQDYSLGATKGGEITHFTQFDIDFNQEKSLLETRCSGALTRVYSAIVIEEDVTDTKGQQTGGLAG